MNARAQGQGGGGGGNGNAQTPWQTKGNSNVSSSDYIGTKFSDDLFIKTNSTERIRITGNGDIIFPSFAGTGDALLMRDINGKMKDHPIPSNPREVFTGGNQFIHISALAGWDYNGSTKNSSLANYTGFGGNTNPSEAIDVTGNMRASGNITAQKFLFDAEHGMRFTAADANLDIPAVFSLGPFSASTGQIFPPPCLTLPPDPYNWIFRTGTIQSIAYNSSGNPFSALTLYSANWGGHGLIEVEGTDLNGGATNALWINYFCGRNTLINTNTGLANRGGTVFMGERVSMLKSAQIGWMGGSQVDETVALNIEVNPENNVSRKGIKFNTYDGNAKLISVNNPSSFTLYGTGRVSIGTISPDAALQIGSNTKGLRFRDDGSAVDIQSVGVPLYINSTGNNIYLAPSGGNVGVGTTTPDTKLHVSGGHLLVSNGDVLWGNNSQLAQDQGGNIELGGNNTTTGIGIPYIDFHYSGLQQDFNTRIINDADGRLTLDASTLYASGNMGIGTTSPGAQLHVVADANEFGLIVATNYGANYGYGIQSKVTGDNTKAFAIENNGVETFKLMGNGNLYASRLWTQTPPFPDFVLNKSYKRPTWHEKENYYWQFGRLMYMPSAKEVSEKGLDLSSGFVGLTQNVEENSLDINELFKMHIASLARIEKLEKENERLNKELNAIKHAKE